MSEDVKIKPKDKEFYVSNIALYDAYETWYAAIALAKEEGIEEPQIPDFIVDAMIKISTRLSYKPNFINYTFRDDFISDSLYDCVRFVRGFKLTYTSKDGEVKKGNPFSYITTIAFNAFLRRIEKEKIQTYTEAQIVLNTPMHDFLLSSNADDAEYKNLYIEFLKDVGSSADSMPMSLKRIAKAKALVDVKGPLDEF